MRVITNNLKIPQYCKYGLDHPGYHCMLNKCDYVGFSFAPLEIAYADEKGEVDVYNDSAWTAFGGDMEPENLSEVKRIQCKKMWEEICKKKIEEAYEEYMLKTGFEKYSKDDNL